ncbi:MAG: tryptophan 7-halogenase [Pseudomonadota bacterium]|nr:tryptophan 7-halogenase [Pseudomonadota bacterium]
MNDLRLKKIVIVGGGTAGWMCAAALTKAVDMRHCSVDLIESDDIGTIGVGEATIPTIHWFNAIVGLDEKEFMRETRATFKLGIEFQEWARPDHRFFHPFGRYGLPGDGVAFQHRWIKARLEGLQDTFEDYSLNTVAARSGKFSFPVDDPRSRSPFSTLGYAYHFDASLYAKYLRKRSELMGVKRHEGTVERIDQHPETGFVTALHTNRGQILSGDLFIDCTGIRALLIEGVLKTGFDDWSHWLPCDRAQAVPCERVGPPVPYTRSTARAAGWQWRIPLQHRTGNGYVYCSQFISDDEAAAVLLRNLDGPALADPRPIRFKAGCRRQAWNKNVIAIGLSSGFLEPLESTSIHLIQSGIAKLLSLFPDRDCDPYVVKQYNRVIADELAGVRDFLALHYHSTTMRTEPLWTYCRAMALPDSLIYREEHFARSGRIVLATDELFKDASWFAVLLGQGHSPRNYNPLIDSIKSADNFTYLRHVRQSIKVAAAKMPDHLSFLA